MTASRVGCYLTPDIFGNPVLGKAMASSTPVPLHGIGTLGGTEGGAPAEQGGGGQGGVRGVGLLSSPTLQLEPDCVPPAAQKEGHAIFTPDGYRREGGREGGRERERSLTIFLVSV